MKIVKEVVCTSLGTELVLFHAGSGQYFGLNQVGSFIWLQVADGVPAATIVERLQDTYEVDEPTATREVERLLRELTEARLLTRETPTA
jgi:hypothetical protein